MLRRTLPRAAMPPRAVVAERMAALPPLMTSHLPNGATVTSEHVPDLDFSTIGVWIDAGSRVETMANNGVAHFLEHLNFKGSRNYTKSQIESTFERLGGHFNAYTARDRTAYYLKVMNRDADATMRLLADILLHSNLAPPHVELERPTILAEMREVESLVDEVIMDNLHLTAYDHSVSGLPLTILGPTANIEKTIDRPMLRQFVETHYTGPRMNIVCSGGLAHPQVENIAASYFGDIPAVSNKETPVSRYAGGDYTLWNSQMLTANLAWAIPICGVRNLEDNAALQLVHGMLGGYRRAQASLFQHLPRANSRFSGVPELESIQPFFTPYEETGLFGFYYVTVPSEGNRAALRQVLEHNLRALHEMAVTEVPVDELEEVKRVYAASQHLLLDSTTNRAEDIGRHMIHYGRRVSLEEQIDVLRDVTPADLCRVLQKYFVGARPSISAIGAADALPTFDSSLDLLHRGCDPRTVA